MEAPKRLKENEERVIRRKLRNAIGEEKVKDDELSLATYAFDASPRPFSKPLCVVLPASRDDVRETLLIANRYRIPVAVMSSGVTQRGHTVSLEGGIAIDLRRMNKVIEINTDAGYAVIEPGVNFDKFSGELSKKGFRCHMTTAPGGAAVLGNNLLRSSGSLSTRQLDSILDVEVVLPDGAIANTGSSHFPGVGSHMRYGPFPDLSGLFCCAYGTLGVITKAAIRIYPINESTKVSVATFDSFASAVDFVKDIINHNIPEHCIIWNWQLYRMFEISNPDNPVFEIPTELTKDPVQAPAGSPYSVVTSFLSGYEETIKSHDKVCAKVAQKYGGNVLSQKEAEGMLPGSMKGWDQLYVKYRPVVPLSFFGLGKYLPWIVMTEPKDVKDLEKWAVKEISKLSKPVSYYAQPFDFGRSIFFRIFVFPEASNKKLIEAVGKTYSNMYKEAMKRYGAIPYRHNPGQPFISDTGGYYDLLKRIKQAVDPNNILSPHIALFKEEKK